MKSDFDWLIVGAGLYGVTFARMLTNAGCRCLIIDKRKEIGGNCYDVKLTNTSETLDHYATWHQYGPHIFHTSNEEVWKFVNKYAKFNHFILNVLAIDDDQKLYHLPFNMNTMYDVFGLLSPHEASAKITDEIRNSGLMYRMPQNLEEQAIKLVGTTIYNKLVKNYTEKQWNASCKELSPEIIKRLPTRMNYDNNYFNDTYQGIPLNGYTEMIKKMISGNHDEKDIPVILEVDFLKDREGLSNLASNILYCGSVDELFDYDLGVLQWRSLEFNTSWYELGDNNTRANSIFNFVGKNVEYTRIVEHVWFTPEIAKYYYGCKVPKTLEKSIDWKIGLERYYPIGNSKENDLYSRYVDKLQRTDKTKNITLGGRLGKHCYFDMDDTISDAMEDAKWWIRKNQKNI